MGQLLQRLFRQEGRETGKEHALELERQARDLCLELEERDQTITNLKGELERLRDGVGVRVAQEMAAQAEGLFDDVAAPVVQLLTQAHLLEAEGKPVQAKDVLAVAKRLVRALEDHGLMLEGAVGETAPFDPSRHEPLSGITSLETGQTVAVRFVSASFQGRVLRKAGVEPASSDELGAGKG